MALIEKFADLMVHNLWQALLAKTVCYAVGLAGLLIGLWPWAVGLLHARSRLAQP